MRSSSRPGAATWWCLRGRSHLQGQSQEQGRHPHQSLTHTRRLSCQPRPLPRGAPPQMWPQLWPQLWLPLQMLRPCSRARPPQTLTRPRRLVWRRPVRRRMQARRAEKGRVWHRVWQGQQPAAARARERTPAAPRAPAARWGGSQREAWRRPWRGTARWQSQSRRRAGQRQASHLWRPERGRRRARRSNRCGCGLGLQAE